jgi:hypothetical protein
MGLSGNSVRFGRLDAFQESADYSTDKCFEIGFTEG